MAQFDAILWDIDGTLLWGHGLGRATTKIAMEKVFGLADGLDTHHFGGKTDFQTLMLLLTPHGYTEDSIREKMTDFAETMAVTMAALAKDYEIRSLPGAPELLAQLITLEGLLHGLVTGNVRQAAPVKLRAAGYDPAVFTFGAFGDESPNRNDLPPKAIARAAKLAGRDIPPERVLIIGDTRMDIEAARAAGAKVCAVATGSDNREILAAEEPDYLLDGLSQFLDVVQI